MYPRVFTNLYIVIGLLLCHRHVLGDWWVIMQVTQQVQTAGIAGAGC